MSAPGWVALQRSLRLVFSLVYDQPTWCGLRWQFGDALVDQRVELVEAYGEPWVQVVTEVCGERAIAARAVLEASLALPIGAVVLEGHRYMIRYAAPLALVEFARMATWMERLANQAARLRPALPGPDVSTFACYAE